MPSGLTLIRPPSVKRRTPAVARSRRLRGPPWGWSPHRSPCSDLISDDGCRELTLHQTVIEALSPAPHASSVEAFACPAGAAGADDPRPRNPSVPSCRPTQRDGTSCVSYLRARVRGRVTGKVDDLPRIWSEAERAPNQRAQAAGPSVACRAVALDGARSGISAATSSRWSHDAPVRRGVHPLCSVSS